MECDQIVLVYQVFIPLSFEKEQLTEVSLVQVFFHEFKQWRVVIQIIVNFYEILVENFEFLEERIQNYLSILLSSFVWNLGIIFWGYQFRFESNFLFWNIVVFNIVFNIEIKQN